MGSATCLQPGPRSAGETVSLVHGGGQQQLERFLECLRLGVEEGGEGLEFRGKSVGLDYHVNANVCRRAASAAGMGLWFARCLCLFQALNHEFVDALPCTMVDNVSGSRMNSGAHDYFQYCTRLPKPRVLYGRLSKYPTFLFLEQ